MGWACPWGVWELVSHWEQRSGRGLPLCARRFQRLGKSSEFLSIQWVFNVFPLSDKWYVKHCLEWQCRRHGVSSSGCYNEFMERIILVIINISWQLWSQNHYFTNTAEQELLIMTRYPKLIIFNESAEERLRWGCMKSFRRGSLESCLQSWKITGGE